MKENKNLPAVIENVEAEDQNTMEMAFITGEQIRADLFRQTDYDRDSIMRELGAL